MLVHAQIAPERVNRWGNKSQFCLGELASTSIFPNMKLCLITSDEGFSGSHHCHCIFWSKFLPFDS